MSKASTASLQQLLRQLYLAKSSSSSASSIEGAAAALISSGSGSNSLGSGSSRSSAAGAASYSTTARALHAAQDTASSSSTATAAASSSQAGSHHHHAQLPASASTGDWTATTAGSSSSSSNVGNTASKARSHAHHYHRHNANHHHVSSSSSSLLPQFWMQSPPSGTTSPPLPPPFNSTSTSTSSSSNTPPLNYSNSSATSSSSLTAGAAPSTSQHSDQHYTIPSSTSLDQSHHNPSSINDHSQQEQNNKVSTSGLTLLPGAYGIPKRVGPPPSSAKGKGKEVMDDNDSVQAQIAQMRESLLSVQVGEDAYFVRHDALGVADGVGGWSGRKGADPGLFAARLMHHCSAELDLAEQLASSNLSKENGGSPPGKKKSGSQLAFVSSASTTVSTDSTTAEAKTTPANRKQEQEGLVQGTHVEVPPEHFNAADTSLPAVASGDPIEVLHRAWDLTLTEFFELELIGSSTALIALLKNDELRLANIGDCSLSIIRGNEYIFRSQEQQHSFNYPFQIGTNSKDTPKKDSQFFNIKILKDDLVILSSDGLVDNLFDEDILEEVQRYTTPTTSTDGENGNGNELLLSPERLSKALCSRAKAVSEDQRAVTSPFQQRANEEGIHFVGGKHDDITVLVAVIGDKSETGTAA